MAARWYNAPVQRHPLCRRSWLGRAVGLRLRSLEGREEQGAEEGCCRGGAERVVVMRPGSVTTIAVPGTAGGKGLLLSLASCNPDLPLSFINARGGCSRASTQGPGATRWLQRSPACRVCPYVWSLCLTRSSRLVYPLVSGESCTTSCQLPQHGSPAAVGVSSASEQLGPWSASKRMELSSPLL